MEKGLIVYNLSWRVSALLGH